jgi:hypothetical protein
MNTRSLLATLCVATSVLTRPSPAEACGGGSPSPLSVHVNSAAAVFIGTVEAVAGVSQPIVVTFRVTKAYRGQVERRAVVAGYCGIAFEIGETYLVYAEEHAGRLMTDSLRRTRPLSAAAEDLRFLDHLAAATPQAVVYGDVFRGITAPDGTAVKQALFETLEVVALSARGRRSVATDRWGPYQIILKPGEYELWVERRGQRVTAPTTLMLHAGEERRLSFTAEYRY